MPNRNTLDNHKKKLRMYLLWRVLRPHVRVKAAGDRRRTINKMVGGPPKPGRLLPRSERLRSTTITFHFQALYC